MEHQEMMDERLNKAEQQLDEANRRADEATEEMKAFRISETIRRDYPGS